MSKTLWGRVGGVGGGGWGEGIADVFFEGGECDAEAFLGAAGCCVDLENFLP